MNPEDKRFVILEKIIIEEYQKYKLDKDYYKANRLYNNVVRYVKTKIKNIERSKRYKNIVKLLTDKNTPKEKKKEYYLYKALESEIAICKIVRKVIKNKYVYYLQIVLKGIPPKKFVKGKGIIGIDQGTSTIAYYKNDLIGFEELAPDIDKFNKEIIRIQRKMNRKLALNNPDCYNEDGTIKKGSKFKRSKAYMGDLFKLKDVYRRKTIYVQQEHNKLVKFLLSNCDTIVKETLDFQALQKRVKGKAKKQEKKSKVIDKKGNIKYIYKFKKKKRFGKSLNNHSPGYLDAQLLKKAEEYGVNVIKVDMKKYRASQYNHDTDEYIRPSLSDRFKIIDEHKVQRDLYSSFLLCNYKDEETISREKCIEKFDNFIKQQDELIKEVKDNTGNFGLKHFI